MDLVYQTLTESASRWQSEEGAIRIMLRPYANADLINRYKGEIVDAVSSIENRSVVLDLTNEIGQNDPPPNWQGALLEFKDRMDLMYESLAASAVDVQPEGYAIRVRVRPATNVPLITLYEPEIVDALSSVAHRHVAIDIVAETEQDMPFIGENEPPTGHP